MAEKDQRVRNLGTGSAMTTIIIWAATLAVVGVLLGLTALAFRGGRQSAHSVERSGQAGGSSADSTWLSTRNRFNETGGG